MALCKDCKKETPTKRFATYRTRKGELRRRHVCWDCRNKYQHDNNERLKEYRRTYNKKNRTKKAKRTAERREELKEFIDKVKDVPCTDCGLTWPPVAMDFDHVRGEKTKSIAQMYSAAYRLELVIEEIAKCEVVCACCHRIRTWKRGENLAPNQYYSGPKYQ